MTIRDLRKCKTLGYVIIKAYDKYGENERTLHETYAFENEKFENNILDLEIAYMYGANSSEGIPGICVEVED